MIYKTVTDKQEEIRQMYTGARDNALRHGIIRAGRMDQLHQMEAVISRDDLGDRAEYRRRLEQLANEVGIEHLDCHSPAPPYG